MGGRGGGAPPWCAGALPKSSPRTSTRADGPAPPALPSSPRPPAGRWTAEEHDLFEKGLQLYGRDWRKIGTLIPTRNIVQIRTHAQKYFLKQQKSAANPECSPQMKVRRGAAATLQGRGGGGLSYPLIHLPPPRKT